MSKKSLREQMPEVTAFIDSLRVVFGKDAINDQIRKGMAGEAMFWASEGGHEIGKRNTEAKSLVMRDSAGVAFSVEIPAGASIAEERRLLDLAWNQRAEALTNKEMR